VVSILGWALPALAMLGKGFAVEDEGTYLLTYRFWDSNPFFVAGAQYFYGPIFEALGENIPLLRLLRLVMVVAANAWFAHCFLAWWVRQREVRLPSSRSSLLLLLTATGGMAYLWAPLTPGYHDLAAEACLVLVSLLLVTLRSPDRPRAWVPLASGVVGVTLVVTKWTAFPVFLLTVGVALWVLARGSRRVALGYAGWVGAGVAVALLVLQVLLVPFTTIMRTLWQVTSLNVVGSHSPGFLAENNALSVAQALLGALAAGLPLLVGFVVGRVADRRGHPGRAVAWLLSGAVLTMVFPFAVGWRGGRDYGPAMVAAAFGGLALAIVVAGTLRSARPRLDLVPRLVLVVLLTVPLLQAAGTNIPVFWVAGTCLALWAALALMLVSGTAVPRFATTSALTGLAVLVLATAMVSGSTTVMTPFKTSSLTDDTVRVPELGVSLDPETAGQDAALVAALRPYVVPGRTPVITLDRKAGFVYLLGGVPLGSPWTDAASLSRTAGIIELACRDGDVPAGRAPVLIVDRAVDPALEKALAGCGFRYPADYRVLAVPTGPPGVRVLVPSAGS
jgi:hypothetical protein